MLCDHKSWPDHRGDPAGSCQNLEWCCSPLRFTCFVYTQQELVFFSKSGDLILWHSSAMRGRPSAVDSRRSLGKGKKTLSAFMHHQITSCVYPRCRLHKQGRVCRESSKDWVIIKSHENWGGDFPKTLPAWVCFHSIYSFYLKLWLRLGAAVDLLRSVLHLVISRLPVRAQDASGRASRTKQFASFIKSLLAVTNAEGPKRKTTWCELRCDYNVGHCSLLDCRWIK